MIKKVLSKNPVMEWISRLTGGQRAGILIGIFGLGIVVRIIVFFQREQPGRLMLLSLSVGWVIANLIIYLVLGFQVHWKPGTRNMVATFCSLGTLLMVVLVLAVDFLLLYNNPTGEPQLAMESVSSDGACTIQIYKTDFSFWDGYDGEVYVEWSDRPEEKEHIMSIENSYQMRISWFGNERVTVNDRTFYIQDGDILGAD